MEFKSVDDKPIKTLEDLINYETFFDIEKYYVEKDDTQDKTYTTLFDVYFNFIKDRIIRIKTKESHKKYNYNPKLLSKDMYGTPALDWVLLKINNMSPSRFRVDNYINFIKKDDLIEIFNFLTIKRNNRSNDEYEID